jgi:hypothetical protein
MMELDDLKKNWEAANKDIQIPQRNIQEMIRASNGHLNQLRKRFRKGMILMPFIALVSISELSSRHSFMMEVIRWYIVGFCFLMMIYFGVNYIMLNKLERMEGDVKENLEKQVRFLSKGYSLRLIITRTMPLVLFILVEILMIVHPQGGFTKWAGQPLIIRMTGYAVIFIALYFFTSWATYHRYKKHIEHLQSLVKELS